MSKRTILSFAVLAMMFCVFAGTFAYKMIHPSAVRDMPHQHHREVGSVVTPRGWEYRHSVLALKRDTA